MGRAERAIEATRSAAVPSNPLFVLVISKHSQKSGLALAERLNRAHETKYATSYLAASDDQQYEPVDRNFPARQIAATA
jgi:hypothetical protein